MAERVGFVPDEPSILNDFGRITMASGPLAPSPVDTSRPEVASRIGRGRQEALAATLCPRDAALTERDLLQAVQRHAKLLGGVELPSTQRFQYSREYAAEVDHRTRPVLPSGDSPRRRLHGRSPIGKLPGSGRSGA